MTTENPLPPKVDAYLVDAMAKRQRFALLPYEGRQAIQPRRAAPDHGVVAVAPLKQGDW